MSYGFADPLKKMLNAGFGFTMADWEDREWKERELSWLPGVSPRKLAQTLGTEWGRDSVTPDLWIRLADQWIETLNAIQRVTDGIAGVVFPDMRFENEAAWLRSKGGVIWHVDRKMNGAVREHVSERGLKLHRDDTVALNYGDLPRLRGIVHTLMEVRA